MNPIVSIAAITIVMSTMSIAAYAQSRDFDAAAFEMQGGPIAAPTIQRKTRAETPIDTAARTEQARTWSRDDIDFAELEAYAVPLKRGTVEQGDLRVARAKAR